MCTINSTLFSLLRMRSFFCWLAGWLARTHTSWEVLLHEHEDCIFLVFVRLIIWIEKESMYGRNGEIVTKHEHCCMKYANRKLNYQMARSISIQRHHTFQFGIINGKKTHSHNYPKPKMFKINLNVERQNCIIKTNWTFWLMFWMNMREKKPESYIRPLNSCSVHLNGLFLPWLNLTPFENGCTIWLAGKFQLIK